MYSFALYFVNLYIEVKCKSQIEYESGSILKIKMYLF